MILSQAKKRELRVLDQTRESHQLLAMSDLAKLITTRF